MKFRYNYSEDTDEYTVPVIVSIAKLGGDFKVGDSIYIDTISAGSNKQALLPYVYWDGTSMSCPYVTAEAMILYSGMMKAINILTLSAARLLSERIRLPAGIHLP